MSFIQHRPGRIPHPKQFLQRKLNSFNQRQAYLKSIRRKVIEQDEDVTEAIDIARMEYDVRYKEIDDQLRRVKADKKAINDVASDLLDSLDDFERFFASKLNQSNIEQLSDEELAELIEALNDEYEKQVTVS